MQRPIFLLGLLAALTACAEPDALPDFSCDDDSQFVSCDQTREGANCPEGQLPAVRDACIQCVVADTCLPTTPPTNGAKLQLLHHMPGATTATVDVYVNGALAFDDLSYREGSDFIDVPSGPLRLEIRDAAGAKNLQGWYRVTTTPNQRHIALMAGSLETFTYEREIDGEREFNGSLDIRDIGVVPDLPPSNDFFSVMFLNAGIPTRHYDIRSDDEEWRLLFDAYDDDKLPYYSSQSQPRLLDALTDDFDAFPGITKGLAVTSIDSTDTDRSRYFSAFLNVTDRGGQHGTIVMSPDDNEDTLGATPRFYLHTSSGGPGEEIEQGL